ncbi:extracellular protein [Aspergillus bombycis]|uniref:Extracellular protein n=1 Tax=Aspergillus bombycis TaxID=109264 RepID=A0A1F8ABS4_9EURO|nr:extracellular protein [Aspergillus bombycis]OGM49186.1 extracellular protein [Aspergillus bombycis]
MKGLAFVCGLLATSVSAHMQMSKPYPIRSPLNKDADGEKDYSYTNPLSTSGSDYPCKGYANDPFNSVATYSPGQEYEMELQGSATHGGGSCQIGLSYDKGKSFHVIHSILGGCPIEKKYKFTVPTDAPNGEALLSWTWFNKVGNREMYMNCAQVTIGGSAKRAISRRDSFDSLPEIFQANNDGPGKCTTIEGEEVNFPLPGPSKEGSLSGKGYTCKSSAPFLGDSSSAETTTSSSAAAHGPKSSANMFGSASPSAAPTDRVASAFGTSSAARATPSSSQPARFESHPLKHHELSQENCKDGTIICSQDGQTWSICDFGRPRFMGSVAAGMRCRHGAMHRAW